MLEMSFRVSFDPCFLLAVVWSCFRSLLRRMRRNGRTLPSHFIIFSCVDTIADLMPPCGASPSSLSYVIFPLLLTRDSSADPGPLFFLALDGSMFMGERLTVQFARGARNRETARGPERGPPRPRRTPYRMQITGLPGETSWQVRSLPVFSFGT